MIKSIKLAVVSATTALALTATGVAVAEEKVDAPAAVVQNHTSDLEAAKVKLADLKKTLEEARHLLETAKTENKTEDIQAANRKWQEAEAVLTAVKNEFQDMLQKAHAKHNVKNEAKEKVDIRVTRSRTSALKQASDQVDEIEQNLQLLREKMATAELDKNIAAGKKQAIEERQKKIAEYSELIGKTETSIKETEASIEKIKVTIQEAEKESDALSKAPEPHKATNSEQNDQQMDDEKTGDSKIFSIIAAVLGALSLAGLAARFIPMIMKFFNR
ncbi:hypothetical protein [Corynebacterium rouxii]|uniref:Uncharacterized protein n=1 Tax=Corynebacterium rouxii TaxID=2719119 RepID=A0ABU3PL00_9CORY|nr:hypothetical protein [Corynebacterium rouxii]MDT9408335.1 hypothetical protein [Corynebacterium rouxii]MDT9410514.1 hypothetical protein [Corynebacterium rouxii]